jgi:DNA-binding transcriptional LysR family regulator
MDGAETLHALRDGRVHGGRVGDVGDGRVHRAALGLDRLARLQERIEVFVNGEDPRAFAREQQRRSAAVAHAVAGRTRTHHYRDLAFQAPRHRCFPYEVEANCMNGLLLGTVVIGEVSIAVCDGSSGAVPSSTMQPVNRKPSSRIKLDPVSLQFLVGVIEEGTIAAVAERHHIAASAVSKRLSDLESLLGTSLIRRTNRGIEPTAAGTVLLNLARGVLHDLDEIYFQMREYSTGVRGQVRLLANRSSITEFLPNELKDFMALHPQVHVRLEERISPVVVRSVANNEADVGLFVLGDYPADMELLPYHVDELVVITPKGHPLEGAAGVTFADTLEYDYIGLHEEAVLQLLKAAGKVNKTLKLRIQVSSFDALCAMVGAGLGIGVLPRNCVRPYMAGQDLNVVALREPWAMRELKICFRSYEGLTAAAKRLVDHLANRGPSRAATAEPAPGPIARAS